MSSFFLKVLVVTLYQNFTGVNQVKKKGVWKGKEKEKGMEEETKLKQVASFIWYGREKSKIKFLLEESF